VDNVKKDISAEKYLYSREFFREQARKEFSERNLHAIPLIRLLNDYAATTMLGSSGCDVSTIPNAQYNLDLMVSFTRTHFIIMDLIVCCELIEACTLLRKQFELVARLNEIRAAGSIKSLLKRTPNLAALRTRIKALYGSYSQISHSADPVPLELLGRIFREDGDVTVVYPTFSENAYVSLNHAAVTVFEYYYWAHEFLSLHVKSYDQTWGEDWIIEATKKHKLMCEGFSEAEKLPD
jgi:hypothetical protein